MIGTIGTASIVETSPGRRLERARRKNGATRGFGVGLDFAVAVKLAAIDRCLQSFTEVTLGATAGSWRLGSNLC